MRTLAEALAFLARKGATIVFSDPPYYPTTKVDIRVGQYATSFVVVKLSTPELYETALEIALREACVELERTIGEGSSV